jgi:hypothetical protein
LARINNLASGSAGLKPAGTGGPAVKTPVQAPQPPLPTDQPCKMDQFFPVEPRTIEESKVSDTMMEELICKYLLAKGEASIRAISNQIGMPFKSSKK